MSDAIKTMFVMMSWDGHKVEGDFIGIDHMTDITHVLLEGTGNG